MPRDTPNTTTSTASLEASARATLEARMQRVLTDQEWTLYRNRLLAYVRVLKSWEQKELSS